MPRCVYTFLVGHVDEWRYFQVRIRMNTQVAERFPTKRVARGGFVFPRDTSANASTNSMAFIGEGAVERPRHGFATGAFREALAVAPNHLGTIRPLANLLATCPDETLRNTTEAAGLSAQFESSEKEFDESPMPDS